MFLFKMHYHIILVKTVKLNLLIFCSAFLKKKIGRYVGISDFKIQIFVSVSDFKNLYRSGSNKKRVISYLCDKTIYCGASAAF